MAVIDITELPALLPRYGALVGLDLGEKTIGIAVSDPTRTVATPLETLRKAKFTDDAEALFKLMDGREVAGIVIGLPVNMDGTEGARCQSNRAFARNLLRLRAGLAITFWDERMSTMAVNRVLIDEMDATRAKREGLVDQMAASWILQGALERLRGLAVEKG
jgi:putative Holliday junction resolvase